MSDNEVDGGLPSSSSAVTDEGLQMLLAELKLAIDEQGDLVLGDVLGDAFPPDQVHAALLEAAFEIAVERRFAGGNPPAEVAEFVARRQELRLRLRRRDPVDPRIAECLVLAVWTDLPVRYAVVEAVLPDLVRELQLDDAGLVAFLQAARERADEWLA